MRKISTSLFFLAMWFTTAVSAQVTTKKVDNIIVSNSTVVRLGRTAKISDLRKVASSSHLKTLQKKRFKKVPDNFKGRTGKSKSVYPSLEHQGPDPIRQSTFENTPALVEPLVNVQGLGDVKSPHDPTGDISDKYYVQMINGTDIGVYDLNGKLLSKFGTNTLWNQFSQSSFGDPIVLYDENERRWILTEYATPTTLLIAISDDDDPLGSYTIYDYKTPNFPDYPKYAIFPGILTVTTNEEGGSNLHNYFIDLKALYAGNQWAKMQRIEIIGNASTEGGFYVTTPVDWNGLNMPFDDRPITITINDSSWPRGPDQDQIEVYTFDVDFSSISNSEVYQTSILTTPFDSYPCSQGGFQFSCMPQGDGGGLDGLPEVIMNLPHLRNFGTHESMVFSFITDVTDGDNRSGIRWLELRRISSENEWYLYQEGTFAPEDEMDRFMPSIAIDEIGNIGLAYNVSSLGTFVGARFTGRRATDPLGIMNVLEYNIIDGTQAISSGGRFGDYSHMSVSPGGDNTFWWTSEYAGSGSAVTQTRIVAFKITKDSFDLALLSIDNPSTSATLGRNEQVSATIRNSGQSHMSDYKVELTYRGEVIETLFFNDTIEIDETKQVTFDSQLDLAAIDVYNIAVTVTAATDVNSLNDSLAVEVRQLHVIEGGIQASVKQSNCTVATPSTIMITNFGATPIDTAHLSVTVNGAVVDTIRYHGSISYDQSASIKYDLLDLPAGENKIAYELISLNGESEDGVSGNNFSAVLATNLPADHFITLAFQTDRFPLESNWELYTENADSLVAFGSFEDEESLEEVTICVEPDSCYIFVVTDAQNDGICCDFGQGYFNIYDNQGILIAANNGNFGREASEAFCATGMACALSLSVSTTDATSETSTDGTILLEASAGSDPYFFSIDGGKIFHLSGTFNNLLPGNYEVIVKDGSGLCVVTDSVSIGSTSSVFDFKGRQVDVTISPNPSNGVIKILIENLAVDEPSISIEILTIDGQVIQEREIGKYSEGFRGTFSIMDYPAGTYLLRINHPDFSHMEKIVRLPR